MVGFEGVHMKKVISILALLFLLIISFKNQIIANDEDDYGYGDKQSVDYVIDGTMPYYFDNTDSNTNNKTSYSYGYVFNDVNDYYYFDEKRQSWLGSAPLMNTSVLIGGNAFSKHDSVELDFDSNDFNSVLPYANIYINPDKLTYEKGEIEYHFYSTLFNYNNSENSVPSNIVLKGNKIITDYQKKYVELDNTNNNYQPFDFQGIVYTGGVSKTYLKRDGTYNETVVDNDEKPLFTARFKDAVIDENGDLFDLLLTFNRIVFVAEADVNGVFEILEENRLCVSSILYKDNEYSIKINDYTDSGYDKLDGIRVGARFEYDYVILDKNEEKIDGLIMFSMNDLDNASMSKALQTNAFWGANKLGNDFRWAEGFGVVDGAASFAVIPRYNHEIRDAYNLLIDNHNGDDGLLRISRMNDSASDGKANGLYFTTSITSTAGFGTRNDSNTMDTGVSMLLKTKGSFVSTVSAGRRGDVSMTLFDSDHSNKIEQSSSEGGEIYSMDYSFKNNGFEEKNTAFVKVVGGGTSSTHYMMPDKNHTINSIRIDGINIAYHNLKWQESSGDVEEASIMIDDVYGRNKSKSHYSIFRNKDGLVWLTFEDIQDNHEIYVSYEKYGISLQLRNIDKNVLVALFLISGFSLLFIISTICWMIKGKKE